ncbi:hypothetical protein DPMN_041947 [Dreissena polymorpha]|uniref:Uncharacterized protein n=1 Tax=Dreissena polymorpha TaxID=45954 RepID=A0A9D4CZJ1_DREPO|nr:hypothetical protein DPMN_041947 [Dreissena polymorpha]
MDKYVLFVLICGFISLKVSRIAALRCAVCTGYASRDYCDIEDDLHHSYSIVNDCESCLKITTTAGAVRRICVRGKDSCSSVTEDSVICSCVQNLCNSNKGEGSTAPYGPMIATRMLLSIVVLGIVALRWQFQA